jgi:hypothetical protein
MTPDEEISRANEAERLMREPLVAEAFEKIEAGIIDAMRKCSLADHAAQHELIQMLHLFSKVKGHFLYCMETGKLARLRRETMRQKADRLLRRVR